MAAMRWRRFTLRCLVPLTRAAWQAVLDSRHHASSQMAQTECTHSPKILVRRANQWATVDVCDKKRGGCGAITNYYPTAAASAHREAKAKAKEKGKGATISQRAARIVSGGSVEEDKDSACPRCNRELNIFNTASGPVMRCRGWDLAGTRCTLIKTHLNRAANRAANPGRSRSTNHTRGGGWGTGSGGPHSGPSARTPAGQGDEATNPPLSNDWTAQMMAFCVQSRVGARTIRSVATSPSTLPALSVPTAACGDVHPCAVASGPDPRRGESIGGQSNTGMDRTGV